uniref:Uncharacterized protein n=1 Tax=Vitis vinifera TaxID=29760 RepID=A5BKE1_VITVI|nr:hypothetical protein VITISV_004562 [Vitis vinifera]
MCPTVAKWGCDIFTHGLRSHLQTAITSSFQLQIEHRLKLWTPDFPRFETTYGMNEINFGKILRHGDFATILQLRNECTGLQNGTRVPKGGFTTAKHPLKWRLGCEMEDFKAWRFRNHFAAAKWVYLDTKWHSCAKGPLRSYENFRRGGWAAAKTFRSGRRFSQ